MKIVECMETKLPKYSYLMEFDEMMCLVVKIKHEYRSPHVHCVPLPVPFSFGNKDCVRDPNSS